MRYFILAALYFAVGSGLYFWLGPHIGYQTAGAIAVVGLGPLYVIAVAIAFMTEGDSIRR